MNILLLVPKRDMACKLFNKNLFDFMLKRLEPEHKIHVYSSDSAVQKQVGNRLFTARNGIDALKRFAANNETFMVISRLAICDINFENLIKYHNNHNKDITLVCKNFVKDKSIPIYKLNETKDIIMTTQKRFADCGIYLFKNGVNFENCKSIYSTIESAISNKVLKGYVHRGYWWTSSNIRRRDNGRTFNAC